MFMLTTFVTSSTAIFVRGSSHHGLPRSHASTAAPAGPGAPSAGLSESAPARAG
jgi:hypothetical protein